MKDIFEVQAVFWKDASKYRKWVEVRWASIRDYFENKGKVYPCMSGKFCYNGIWWKCDGKTVKRA